MKRSVPSTISDVRRPQINKGLKIKISQFANKYFVNCRKEIYAKSKARNRSAAHTANTTTRYQAILAAYKPAVYIMRRFTTAILVTLVMLVGILGITNPGFKQPYQLFDDMEGKVTHNYFIFSVYQQNNGYITSRDGKYNIYKRYIGIASNYFEIGPSREEKQ